MKAIAQAAARAFCSLLAAGSIGSAAADFDCLIEPEQVVELRSPVVGLIERVHAHRGEAIRRGQVLVTIESSVEQSAADSARFRATAEGPLQQARRKVEATREKARRMAELYREEFVSAQAKDDAAAEARFAEAELQTAQENAALARLEERQARDTLNRRALRSPFNGVVVDQYLFPGALVDPGDSKKPILKIAQTQPLAVQAILPFRYFPQVRVGSRATVVPEKPFSGSYELEVATVDRVVDSAAGTFGVMLHLPNSRQELPGGIRCKLRLQGLE